MAVVSPLTAPTAAAIELVPLAPTIDTNPPELTVILEVSDDVHVAEAVMSWVPPPVK